jgi:hypothetical protein
MERVGPLGIEKKDQRIMREGENASTHHYPAVMDTIIETLP